ncbi:hypothetical protein BIY24_11635 [Halobacteriovorax marinus]|uniref:Uncharacterized protein n=1 Tax=Halobacteriovorax marinus (strain ATCC BAA-682 / DSM 15412 / SJ) TaxID=862908 RepID=E1X5F4_HALMS|nr:hypothetical protein [Halobacteriovorax marinus]ATH08576.1 hypothetical protein BIY24_11635 [Halobacteriovorax marinus]CBW27275.1 hypothetical protein BMS_2484 [Halobacteriovorax marinus SJ]
MRLSTIIFVGLLNYVLFDLRKARVSLLQKAQATSYELSDEKNQRSEKKQQRKYKNKKYKKRKFYQSKNYYARSTSSKDKRYSNQRTLRRMYRNC